MANYSIPARRLFPAAVLALAVVGSPLLAVTTTPIAVVSTSLAACTSGEEEDVYTTSCVPMLVPNSPDDGGFSTNAANPDIPEIEGAPGPGHDSGACIGLAEEQQAEGPQPIPQSTISSSP